MSFGCSFSYLFYLHLTRKSTEIHWSRLGHWFVAGLVAEKTRETLQSVVDDVDTGQSAFQCNECFVILATTRVIRLRLLTNGGDKIHHDNAAAHWSRGRVRLTVYL